MVAMFVFLFEVELEIDFVVVRAKGVAGGRGPFAGPVTLRDEAGSIVSHGYGSKT